MDDRLVVDFDQHSASYKAACRTFTPDGEFSGHSFRAGDRVWMAYGLATHDPAAFEAPDEIAPERGRPLRGHRHHQRLPTPASDLHVGPPPGPDAGPHSLRPGGTARVSPAEEDGHPYVESPDVPENPEDLVRKAVGTCPEGAISIDE